MRAPPPSRGRDVSSRKVVPVFRRPLALFAVLALSLAACGEGDPEVEVTTPVEEPTEDVDEPDDDQAAADEDGTDTDDADGDATDGVDDGDEPDTGPEPDPAALADPCAGHEDREGEAFIELVAPVQDQQVADEVTLVGCSNVYEATVSWRLLDADGETIDEGFTTAECGSGCVGAFEETIELDADATAEPTLELQVFWQDAADGSDRDLVEVELVVTS
jgi:hypothetical protein